MDVNASTVYGLLSYNSVVAKRLCMVTIGRKQSDQQALSRKLRWRRGSHNAIAIVVTLTIMAVVASKVWWRGSLLWGPSVLLLTGVTLWFSVNRLITLVVGSVILGCNKKAVGRSEPLDQEASTALNATAIVIPIRNESAARVFAGVRIMWRSLERTRNAKYFHFFVLSDTDHPDCWIEEETAWANLCAEMGEQCKVFYRRRENRINAKSGNIADFLRRWGRRYRYMIVLDADSIMTGATMVKLVATMERHSRVGIVQTYPRFIFGETLFARWMQWKHSMESIVGLAGLKYFSPLGSGYVGHNAIIRVEPFMEHCGLPFVPARGRDCEPFLNHDYVEAMLMRRAGWAVWIIGDWDGSYEECPASISDYSAREKRWLIGKMQLWWLIMARGIPNGERMRLFLPFLHVIIKPIWFGVMILVLLGYIYDGPTTTHASSFGNVPEYRDAPLESVLDLALCFTLAALCLAPSVLCSIAMALNREHSCGHGGGLRIAASAIGSWIAFVITEPIRLLSISKALCAMLLGRGVKKWEVQRRGAQDKTVAWSEAGRAHLPDAFSGLCLGTFVWLYRPSWFWWCSPLVFGFAIAIPWTVFVGRASIGRLTRQMGLFLTPEEDAPSPELKELKEVLADYCFKGDHGRESSWLKALLDPEVYKLHISLLRRRWRAEKTRRYFGGLCRRLMDDGPAGLSRSETVALLRDYESMILLRQQLQVDPSPAWAQQPTSTTPWFSRTKLA